MKFILLSCSCSVVGSVVVPVEVVEPAVQIIEPVVEPVQIIEPVQMSLWNPNKYFIKFKSLLLGNPKVEPSLERLSSFTDVKDMNSAVLLNDDQIRVLLNHRRRDNDLR